MNGRLVLLLLLLPLSTVSAQTVVLTLDAPDTNISGLAYGGGSLWAVDGTTNYLYKLNPSTGAVQGSWYVAPSSSEHPTGLGFGNNQLYIAHTNSYIKIYTTSGVYSSQFTVSCWGSQLSSVTGVGSDASKLYALGTSYYGYSVETFSWTGTVGASPYINSFVGLGTGYDIGYSGSYVWVANDAADSPVRAFNTAGTPVNAIPGSLIANAARGVDFESATLMWVSNPNNDKIYKIDLSVGVGEGQGAEVPSGLAAGPNPFTSSVTIEGGGFGRGAMVTIFDMQGRRVIEEAFPGVFVWDASGVPPGPYFARVTDGDSSQTLRLIRI